MSSTKVINQKEYLKKYLSGGKSADKKKKKKKPHVAKGIQIIDDDEDRCKINSIENVDLLFVGEDEDAPQIAAIIDDRPVEMRFSSDKWKVLDENGVKIEKKERSDYKDDSSATAISIIPAHKIKNEVDSDASPPRRDRGRGSDSDLSPPRKNANRGDDSDLSPPRRRQDKGSDSDLSPPRRKKSLNHKAHRSKGSDSDLSPPRRKKTKGSDSDLSPPRRKKSLNIEKHRSKGSDSDLSPPRRKKTAHSPPRNKESHHRSDDYHSRNRNHEKKERKSRWDTNRSRSRSPRRHDSNKKMDKTLDGKKAGLQDATQLRYETEEMRRKENDMFSKLDDKFSGRNAAAVKRSIRSDKKKLTEEEILQQKEKEERQKELEAKYSRWGKGLKQVQDHEERVKDFIHEASKPLARYRDDEDLEDELKKRERIGDPMLQYMRTKVIETKVLNGEQIIERPAYQGLWQPNRFNIPPGHRWDGVDRSNGYEKTFIETKNSKEAQVEIVYKWSTEDM